MTTNWITPEEWYKKLNKLDKENADKLLNILVRFGAGQPLGWVSSEMRENIPQITRFLILRKIRRVMDKIPFSDLDVIKQGVNNIEKTVNITKINKVGKESLNRLVENGANIQDIVQVFRAIKTTTVLEMISILDNDAYDPSDEGITLGWQLMETNNLESTGRQINALHENIIDLFEEDLCLQ